DQRQRPRPGWIACQSQRVVHGLFIFSAAAPLGKSFRDALARAPALSLAYHLHNTKTTPGAKTCSVFAVRNAGPFSTCRARRALTNWSLAGTPAGGARSGSERERGVAGTLFRLPAKERRNTTHGTHHETGDQRPATGQAAQGRAGGDGFGEGNT